MSEIKVRQIRELVECGAKVVYLPAYTIDTTLTLYGHKRGTTPIIPAGRGIYSDSEQCIL